VNSKQRVIAALVRQPVDRLPVFMWFHPSTTKKLSHLLEISPSAVGEAMGNDVRQAWVNNNYAMEGIPHELEGQGHTDYWGIRWVKKYDFNQIASHPLANATPDELLRYEFPYSHIEDLLQSMTPIIEDGDDYFIGCDVSPCAFEMYWRLRSMENTMLDIAEDPGLARQMLSRCVDFSIALSEKAIQRYSIDWLWTGDDVASQQGMMISPRTWRALIKPELARVCAVAKAHHLWLAYHCCGALRPIIPDLIEIGMNVLNPVQSNCPGMDPLELKEEFGRQISFMGGVDTQELLPHGTANQVCRETTRLIEGMTTDGGGYILAASHTIPPETPDENIFAMYAAAGISREEIFDRAAGVRARER
jgi:uroporphyrinogen decarboxylase